MRAQPAGQDLQKNGNSDTIQLTEEELKGTDTQVCMP